jgi:hypothetical protein
MATRDRPESIYADDDPEPERERHAEGAEAGAGKRGGEHRTPASTEDQDESAEKLCDDLAHGEAPKHGAAPVALLDVKTRPRAAVLEPSSRIGEIEPMRARPPSGDRGVLIWTQGAPLGAP